MILTLREAEAVLRRPPLRSLTEEEAETVTLEERQQRFFDQTVWDALQRTVDEAEGCAA